MQLEMNFNPRKHCVVSLSGGMDSSTLLLRALKEYDSVTAMSFNYGQKHVVELERAQSLVDYLAEKGHKVNYKQIKLEGLSSLLNSALVEGGNEVPEGHYADDNMKATVVPNRNKIFASIVQAVALSVANKTEETCDIALGIHAGDHAIYPDCRQEFRDADDAAFREGNWDAESVGYFTPYLLGDKYDILQDGVVLCNDLGIEFNAVYARTNTSYKPIFDPQTFEWYSDFKSASSVERVEAFIKLERPDPAPYAEIDRDGQVVVVEWEHVVTEVSKILAEHE